MLGTPHRRSRREPRLKKLLLDLDSLNKVKTESFECGLDPRKKSEILPELDRDCRVAAVKVFRRVSSKMEHCRCTETK